MVVRLPLPAVEMMDRPAAVQRWPASFDAEQELLIVAVDTPNTPIRQTARQQVRGVIREILGDIELISEPGQPLRFAGQQRALNISVSHENGLSLLAICRSGQVGIDLLQVPENTGWQAEIPVLAIDYLGQKIARQISELPPKEQLVRFAQAWTKHEARLKCRGLGLVEWNSALEKHLSPCQVQTLILPAGYLGAVATLKAAENPVA